MRAMWLGFAAAIVIALLAAGAFQFIESGSAAQHASGSTRL